ncbi:hypothetical protein FPRO06_08588 [Fusarium proliferatum]|nr:hypothetical protein FPRO06_08588 [Fusarium proliferatum]KAI1049981.1 hypothetical protein LB506_001801 [Fusarium annulatum]CVK91605.1 uncharacterized protein FPRN_09439 [Fusarium proliferatum]
MANRGYLMPDLIEKASKLSIDDLDTNKSPDSISRYEEFPYAHFYDMNKTRDPAGLKKTSPEYHERVRKALKALEEKYLEAYQVYQTWKDELILQIEDFDQHSWNNFILDPRNRMEFGDGILEDLETFLPFSNMCYPFPSCKSQERFSKTLFKRRMQLAEIKGLVETGRRELARLEGSDAFIQLRNEFVKHHEEVAAKCDLLDFRDETSSCASSDSGGTSRDIED